MELALVKSNFLIHTLMYANLLNIVIFVWSIKHLRCVIRVLLFSHACVYSDVGIAKCVHFEWKLKLMIFRHILHDAIIIRLLQLKVDQDKCISSLAWCDTNLQFWDFPCVRTLSWRNSSSLHSALLYHLPTFKRRYSSKFYTFVSILVNWRVLVAYMVDYITTASTADSDVIQVGQKSELVIAAI